MVSSVRAAPPDLAIIGAGLMGRWHAATAHKLGARVVAVVDADPGRACSLARRFGASAFPSIEVMLERHSPRIAHVCTPGPTHVAYSTQLLQAGCHVLCEKPLAAHSADVEMLLERAVAAGRLICPVHQFALQRGVCDVLSRFDDLGAIQRVGFVFCSAGGEYLPPAALDDVVLDIVPHALSVLSRMFPQAQLPDISWRVLRPAAGELQAIGALGQALVYMSFSMSARPTEASATVAGTRGTAYIDFFHGFATIMGGRVSRWHKATRPLKMSALSFAAAAVNLAHRGLRGERAYPGLRHLCSAFYDSIDGGAQPPFSAAEILGIYRARDRLSSQAYAESPAREGT